MKTYEVRVRDEQGEVTVSYYQAESLEALYEALEAVCGDIDIVGCPRAA